MTEMTTKMLETYSAGINNDLQLLAECVKACVVRPGVHRLRGCVSE